MLTNIYCDESNHLEKSLVPWMVLGAVSCPAEKAKNINKRIQEFKVKHSLSPYFEMKWTKISEQKLNFYLDIIDYFFDDDDLSFRAVIINKSELVHKKYNQTHDDFYYKMYFNLLNKIVNPKKQYSVYLDIKDTNSAKKAEALRNVLCNSKYDFDKKVIEKIQHVRSHEVNILQITDLLIGALQYLNRESENLSSKTKKELVERIKNRSGYSLKLSTLVKEEKFNLFYWQASQSYGEQ